MGQRKFDELEGLLYEGSMLLFEKGEFGSGVDLAKLYLEVLQKAEVQPSEDVFKKVAA